MATNPKKSYRRERIKQQAEKVQSQLEILTDCLLDIFDKYSILSYKNADSNTDIYWTYQKVKDFRNLFNFLMLKNDTKNLFISTGYV